jgi:hypothetical protein
MADVDRFWNNSFLRNGARGGKAGALGEDDLARLRAEEREAALRRGDRLVSGAKPVSPEQRVKCRLITTCFVCGRDDMELDGAHVVARRLGLWLADVPEDRVEGGCGHPDCVLAMCRSCHGGYDGTSNLSVNLLSKMLKSAYLLPQGRYERLISGGPATFTGLLHVTREEFHPELIHGLVHLDHLTLGFPIMRRMLIEGSRIFRQQEDEELQARLRDIRRRQKLRRL